RAAGLDIPRKTLEETPELDLTIDGAAEIDPRLALVKGGGGALLREKIVAAASRRMVVVADGAKKVERLGAFPLPIEIVRFGAGATLRRILEAASAAGCHGKLVMRRTADGQDFVTDEGHLIVDGMFSTIPDPARLAETLSQAPGVVEHGLFIGLCSGAIIASATGVEILGSLD